MPSEWIVLKVNELYIRECCVLQSTELSRALDDRPLLFATLGGGMVAVEHLSGNIIWKLKDGKYSLCQSCNEHQFDSSFNGDETYDGLIMSQQCF